MAQLRFLGTSSMVPTKDRAPSSVLLEYEGKGILFDCGEGCQRQMNIAGVNRNIISVICLSHWHADHVAGLTGLLQTLNSKEQGHDLTIIGPPETEKRLLQMMKSTYYDDRLRLTFIESDATEPTVVFETPKYIISAISLEHSTPVLGFSFREKDTRRIDQEKQKELGMPDSPLLAQLQAGKTIEFHGKQITPEQVTYVQKGKSFAYVTDTLFCKNAISIAKDVDLLICESTYSKQHEDKAAEYKHMHAQQAAQIASMAEAKELILTHFSQRYKSVEHLLQEAKEVFVETRIAHDFMTVQL